MKTAIKLNTVIEFHSRDKAEEEWDRIYPTLEIGEWLEVVEITKEVVTAFGPKTNTAFTTRYSALARANS